MTVIIPGIIEFIVGLVHVVIDLIHDERELRSD